MYMRTRGAQYVSKLQQTVEIINRQKNEKERTGSSGWYKQFSYC